jgi:hypothetical protein
MKWIFIPALVMSCFFLSCKKAKTPVQNNEKLFTYNSLTSDVSILKQGDVTNIKASITGSGTCAWSTSAGDLFGNGGVILFGAGSCCTGNHTITCTVSDTHGNSEAKSVVIFVHT